MGEEEFEEESYQMDLSTPRTPDDICYLILDEFGRPIEKPRVPFGFGANNGR